MADFIVAIELGSSKITGIAGKKNLDGSIKVLAVVKEDATSCIRKGVVNNIDKTVQALGTVIKKLENILKTKIARVYVGVNGQSIRSEKNIIVKQLPADTKVTVDMVNGLMDANRSMQYPDQEILDAVTQEYKVDNQLQVDPTGFICTRLEGNFLNILWRKSFYRNLNRCFENAGIAIAEMYLSPLSLADAVLTDAERRGGSILVDLGAETTTVAVYYRDILRHLAVIPLGSNNITKDLTSLQMEDKTAEEMKLKYAAAYTDSSEIDMGKTYPIDHDRSIDMPKFVEIVEARLQEIIENAWHQVPDEYIGKLLGGIVLTGGESNMKDIDKAFKILTHTDKVRIAGSVTTTIISKSPAVTAKDGTMCTVLGLLAKGNMNCAGSEISDSLFQNEQAADSTPDQPALTHTTTEIGKGIIKTEAEKAAEEAAKLKEEEEEKRRRQQEAEEEEERRSKKRENSWFHKAVNGLKSFGRKMVEDEEDEK